MSNKTLNDELVQRIKDEVKQEIREEIREELIRDIKQEVESDFLQIIDLQINQMNKKLKDIYELLEDLEGSFSSTEETYSNEDFEDTDSEKTIDVGKIDHVKVIEK